MALDTKKIKELRDLTGVGISDCKAALMENDNDLDKAVEYLREKGMAAAAKKAGRVAAEGIVSVLLSDDSKKGVVVEVNSETDFVAKNSVFREYVDKVCKQAMDSSSENIEAFLAEKWQEDTSITVADALSQQIAVIGENLTIRRFEKFVKTDAGVLVSYIHGEGRIGVLVDVVSDNTSEAVVEMGKNVAMQIAALNPKFLNSDQVDPEYIAKEKEILIAQIQNDPASSKKPANIIEKMVEGRINKELKEICLTEQTYVKDGDLTIKSYIASVSKELGTDVAVAKFVRFETGEGIEKKVENFADEVNKAMQ